MANLSDSSVIQTQDIYTEPSTMPTLATLSTTNWNGNILLFFIALGFGILFCNLWYIKEFFLEIWGDFNMFRVMIGIKYCYKYSNVNNPEVIEIQGMMPQNQDCPKKLMTQGEADQQFPSILYKDWQLHHKRKNQKQDQTISENEPNRKSLTHNDLTCFSFEEFNEKSGSEKQSIYENEKSRDSKLSNRGIIKNESNDDILESCTNLNPTVSDISYYNSPITEYNDIGIYIPDDKQSRQEDKCINEDKYSKVLSASSSGDTSFCDICAICLDTFQEDDEIRALTCNHIFHSSCIVPWFTTRRAMCPLCKCDFHIPKSSVNTTMENTTENVTPFSEAQIYERMRRSSVVFFSTYEPQYIDQYRIPANNYRQNSYNTESGFRNFISRRFSRFPLFRRNHSHI